MRPYFEKMPVFGREMNAGQIKSAEDNVKQIRDVEAQLKKEAEKVKQAGFSEEKINARGQMTVWQRLDYLVDPGPGAPCTPCTTRKTTWRAPPTSSTVSAKFPGSGPSSSASTTRSWPGPGCPGSPKISCGSPTFPNAEHSPGLAGELQRGQTDGAGKILRQPPGRRHHLFPPRGIESGWAFPFWPPSTVPILPAAATRASARRSCSPTRTATWPWAAAVSSAACRPKASSTKKAPKP
jgi:hypothetical protein